MKPDTNRQAADTGEGVPRNDDAAPRKHGAAAQNHHDSANYTTEPPIGGIAIDRVAPAVAAALTWYGFRWNGKGAAPSYLSFPTADELTLESGDPAAILPNAGNGSPLDIVHAAYLDGAKLDGIAWLAPNAKRPELFRVSEGCLLWTREATAGQPEKIRLLDSMGYYGLAERVLLANNGLLPKDTAATEPHSPAPTAAEGGQPVIDAIPGELHIVVRKAEQALIAAEVSIFQRVGVMVRPATLPVEVQIDGTTLPAGSLVIEPVSKAWLAEKFNEVANWRKYNERKKRMVPTDCPARYAEHYLAKKGEWKIRVLAGIIEAPTLRRDGSLLIQPGYDAQSGIYLNYTGQPVTVPDNPTKSDALKALSVLKEPFEEFPFVGDVDRSVVLSGLLTAITRRSLRTAPYHAADAPGAGSGKGLLVDVCALVATGRPATTTTLGTDEAETEKRLSALLMRGVSIINLDNAARSVEGDFLCALATQETIDPRILGQSVTVTIPSNTAAIFLTGNNLVFKGDMTRRVLLCRIDPCCERPDAREFKRDLRQFVTENRHNLLSAALTVLRAFVCAGRPAHGKAPYGSFEEWDKLVRGALLWLGQPDPLDSRERIVSNDPTALVFRALLDTWFEVFNNQAVTVHEVIDAATPRTGDGSFTNPKGEELRPSLIEVASTREGTSINSVRLGRYLGKNRDKVAGEYRLEQFGTYGSRPLWKVCRIAGFAGSTTQSRNFRSEENGNVDSAKNIVVADTTCKPCTTCKEPPDDIKPADCRRCARYSRLARSCGDTGAFVADPATPLCGGQFFQPREERP